MWLVSCTARPLYPCRKSHRHPLSMNLAEVYNVSERFVACGSLSLLPEPNLNSSIFLLQSRTLPMFWTTLQCVTKNAFQADITLCFRCVEEYSYILPQTGVLLSCNSYLHRPLLYFHSTLITQEIAWRERVVNHLLDTSDNVVTI